MHHLDLLERERDVFEEAFVVRVLVAGRVEVLVLEDFRDECIRQLDVKNSLAVSVSDLTVGS